MSASPFFSWPIARKALKAGVRVRWKTWTNKWLVRWYGGIYWIVFDDGTKRIAQPDDLGEEQFTQEGWTNLPPSCVNDGAVSGGDANSCPVPYTPPEIIVPPGIVPTLPPVVPPTLPIIPIDPKLPPGTGGGVSPGSGGRTRPPGIVPTLPPVIPPPIIPPVVPPTLPIIPIDPKLPPGTGGGVSPGSGGRTRPPITPPTSEIWPEISLTAEDVTDLACYEGGDSGDQDADMQGTVTLSNPAGVSPGPYFVSVRKGGTVITSLTMNPGDTQDWGPTTVSGIPGESSFTFQGRAWKSGSPDIQASSNSVDMKDWCGFACSVFDSDWWSEFEDWPVVADTASAWSPGSGQEVTPMCVRWVGFCNASDGSIANEQVVGMNPSAAVGLTEAEYIAMAAPFRNTAANASTVIALEFYGSRPTAYPGPGLSRPCTGTTDKYIIYKKP